MSMTQQHSAARPDFTLGDKLRKARQFAGVSSQAMADALLRDRNTIGNYEADRTRPTAKVLERWAELCGVDLAWLQESVTGRYLSPAEDEAA